MTNKTLGNRGEDLARRITLFGERPQSWNTYNSRAHWSKRAKEATRAHEAIWEHVRLDKPVDYLVSIAVTVYFKNHPQDCCNIRAKTYIDGLIGYWIVDDDLRYVERVTTIARIDKDNPRVEIEMTPAKAWGLDLMEVK